MHDLVIIADSHKGAIEELRIEIDEMRTERHIIPPILSTTPPRVRYLQKQWWKLSVWALVLAAGTTITVVVTFAVKDCLSTSSLLHQKP